METSSFFWGIIPLLLFVVCDAFSGPKSALIAAIVAALLETILSIVLFKELDWVTAFSFFLVLILAVTSYRAKKQIYIKLQPVILGITLGLTMIVSYLLKKPILLLIFTKYKDTLPPSLTIQFNNPVLLHLLASATMTAGVALCLHALLVAYAAYHWSNWWWLAIRIVGFYIFMMLGTLAAPLL